MPTAVQKPISLVREPAYFGLKTEKNRKRNKSIAWVDVSDDEDRGRKSLKRRNSVVNGHHDGHKQKRRRYSVQATDSPQVNGAGPSQINGARASAHSTPKAKELQEQRRQLPIAKGASPCC